MSTLNEDIQILQTIERYLDNQMLPAERDFFEQMRKNTPEIDQMVVEHSLFLQQMNEFSNKINLKHTFNEIHTKLVDQGDIYEGGETTITGRIIQLYHKYKKITAIAASVGGAIALVISGLMVYLAPVNNGKLQELGQEVALLKQNQQYQGAKLKEVDSKLPKDAVVTGGGSGFLIDPKGYIITNAHVLKGSNYANVMNADHDEFKANIVFKDEKRDLAVLKIEDEDYKGMKSLPYSIKKTDIDLGEEVFTLGYPRNDITYGKGDLSAKTGFNGDTTSCQIQMSANPGNSGGPVFNKSGEVIGILSTREKQAEGVTFAIKSRNIFQLVNDLKVKDTTTQNLKINTNNLLKGKDRVTQIKNIQNCVFLVQAFNTK